MALGLGLLAAAATAAANVWGVPALNGRLLPPVQAAASALLQREVQLGVVNWVAPTGLLGLTPLASVGPVRVGAGPVERSSASLRQVTVGLDPVQSLLQRRIVLAVKGHGAQVRGPRRPCCACLLSACTAVLAAPSSATHRTCHLPGLLV